MHIPQDTLECGLSFSLVALAEIAGTEVKMRRWQGNFARLADNKKHAEDINQTAENRIFAQCAAEYFARMVRFKPHPVPSSRRRPGPTTSLILPVRMAEKGPFLALAASTLHVAVGPGLRRDDGCEEVGAVPMFKPMHRSPRAVTLARPG